MYSAILIDDNPRELEEVRQMLTGSQLGVRLEACFSDSRSALEYLWKTPVDIVVTDIQMPQISGLELLELLMTEGIHCRMVLITCYDDSKYMHRAIKLGVDAYVLKPVLEEELYEVMEKVVRKLDEEKKNQTAVAYIHKSIQELRVNFLRELLRRDDLSESEINSNEKVLDMNLQGMNMCMALLRTEELQTARRAASAMQLELQTAVYTVPISDDTISLLAVSDRPLTEDRAAESLRNQRLRLPCGVSSVVEDVRQMNRLLVESRFALLAAEAETEKSPVLYRSIDYSVRSREDASAEPSRDRQLWELLMHRRRDRVRSFVNGYFAGKAQEDPAVTRQLALRLVNDVSVFLQESFLSLDDMVSGDALFEKLRRFDSIIDIRQWCENILRAAMELLESDKAAEHRVVANVCAIVQADYAKHLTLDEIARRVGFSKRHIHRIFVKAKGMSVLDYLTKYRIDRAQEMLKLPGSKIYVVAREVGYKNKTHFCSVFKEITGQSPAEYKEANARTSIEISD